MPTLAVNGVSVTVLDKTLSSEVEEIGEKTRAFDGTLRSSRQTTKRTWAFEVPFNVPADAEAIRQLFLGGGHAWSFDASHLYSSKGKGPSATAGTPAFASAAKFGVFALQTSNTIGVKYAIPTTAYTVLAWHHNGTVWDHYIVSSAGSVWKNGAAGALVPAEGFNVAAGEVLIGSYNAPAVGTYKTDDLVILPFAIPSAWAASYYAAAAAHGDLPKLAVTGDLVTGIGKTTLAMVGELGDTQFTQGYVSGVFYETLQTIAVTLSEV